MDIEVAAIAGTLKVPRSQLFEESSNSPGPQKLDGTGCLNATPAQDQVHLRHTIQVVVCPCFRD